jgi:EAL domain-containing protein (putative c-di-GMP-specific phosphodiesterase class I)
LAERSGTGPSVEAIVAVAHTLALEVTAEGLEPLEQINRITALHWNRGDYFARP